MPEESRRYVGDNSNCFPFYPKVGTSAPNGMFDFYEDCAAKLAFSPQWVTSGDTGPWVSPGDDNYSVRALGHSSELGSKKGGFICHKRSQMTNGNEENVFTCCANARLDNKSKFCISQGDGCCINLLSLPAAWQHVCTTFLCLSATLASRKSSNKIPALK